MTTIVDEIFQLGYLILGSLCLAFFVFNAVKILFPDQELLAAQERLGVESAVRNYKHWSLKFLSPFYRAMLPRIQQIKMPVYRAKKKDDFIVAGVDDQFDPDEFMGLKICASFVFVIFAAVLLSQFGIQMNLTYAVIALIIGFFLPDYAVFEIKKLRQKAILRELPGTMDLLTLSVEAGMDFMQAITRVIEHSRPGALKEELSSVLKEIQLGTTRADALRNMGERVRLSQVSSFASILIQADEMGSSIGPVLRAQSDLLRMQRFERAERDGARASQKILIPLVVCIMPAVFIVIIGPVICDIYYNQSWFKDFFGG